MNNSNLYDDVYTSYFSKLCLVFVIGYFFVQAFIMSHVLSGAAIDDAEQLVNTSFFALGYGGSQPPLYTWITIIAFKIFGVSLLSLQIVKFTLLTLTFLGVYWAFRLLGISRLIAASAMLSLFLLPQFLWESQRALTHSIVGTASCAWLLAAFAYHIRKNTLISALLLGLMIACSVLGKFNDCLFIISLFAAALTIASYRKIILSMNTLIAFGFSAVLLIAPLLWTFIHKGALLARTQKFAINAKGNPWLDRLLGTSDLIFACLGFMIVAIIVGIVLYIRFKNNRMSNETNRIDGEKLIFRIILIGVFITWIVVMITGATNIKDRWMQPVLFLSAPAIVLYFATRNYSPKIFRIFSYIGMIAAVAIIPLLANYFSLNLFINKNFNVSLLDYKTINETIEKEAPFTTILGNDFALLGNLRLLNPELDAVSVENPDAANHIKLPVLVIWADKNNTNGLIPLDMLQTLIKANLVFQTPVQVIENVGYIHDKGKKTTFYYLKIK